MSNVSETKINQSAMRYFRLTFFVVSILVARSAFAGAVYRPGQEQRTVTASSYQISVQKNGRIDVSLLNGEAVFSNAYPAILVEGEDEWTELDIASRYTFRERVQDALGEGQALIMAKGNCEWAIRTYSTRPFFTVEAVFINTSKKPVRVTAATPWSTGDTRKPGGLSLGADTQKSRALVFEEQPSGFVHGNISQGLPMRSRWHLGLYSDATPRSLIAGFLDLSADTSTFSLNRLPESDEAGPIEIFEAVTTFDDPIEVASGERLKMPVVYFSVSESDPLVGLNRFGQALGRHNGNRADRSAAQFISGESSSAIEELLNIGWRSSETMGRAQDSAQFLQGERSEYARLNPNPPTSWDEVVETLTGAARVFHLNPYFWRLDAGKARLSLASLTDAQRLAWISGLALTGGAMHIELGPESISTDELRRFTPPIDRAALPIDLFRNDRPRIWALPMDTSGDHVVVGLFNWDLDGSVTIELDFAELGLARNAYYTVYDSLPREYLGTATERLRVAVPPGSVRILSLRRHMDRPEVLSYSDHFVTVPSPDHTSKWNAATGTLSGSVRIIGEQPVQIHVLKPEQFVRLLTEDRNVSVGYMGNRRELIVEVRGEDGALVPWQLEFR